MDEGGLLHVSSLLNVVLITATIKIGTLGQYQRIIIVTMHSSYILMSAYTNDNSSYSSASFSVHSSSLSANPVYRVNHCRFLVKQQVSSRNPYNLFPFAASLNSPFTPPRPISPALLSTAYSTTALHGTTREFTPPPIPPRCSHTYEILDSTLQSKTLQRKQVLYETLECPSHSYATLEPDLASSKAESKVRNYHKAECKVPDYHILESTSPCASKKQCNVEYARVNKKK